MLWLFFKTFHRWFTPEWLGKEAARSGQPVTECPYVKRRDKDNFVKAYLDERLIIFHSGIGRPLDDWRTWVVAAILFALAAFGITFFHP